jgi:hypothetical protein
MMHSTAPADGEQATHAPGDSLAWLAPPGPFTDQVARARVARYARCAEVSLDPDQWFPASSDAGKARQEAAAAIAVCGTCLVRVHCLALSLRHWDIGQHGVWGGLVAPERAALRHRRHREALAVAYAGRRQGAATP